jgi:hypothetical protein
MPDQLYDAALRGIRESLGPKWGRPARSLRHVHLGVRQAVSEMDGVHVASEFERDGDRGIALQLWVDRDDLDLSLADDIVSEVLCGLGDREFLVVCRTFERDGLHYRFATGTVDAGLVGTVMLVGPYARDVSHLAQIGRGQPRGFSA